MPAWGGTGVTEAVADEVTAVAMCDSTLLVAETVAISRAVGGWQFPSEF